MDTRFFFLLSRVDYTLKAFLREEFRKAGIPFTPGQTGILFLLRKRDLMNMSELSRALETDNSAVTRLVDSLERGGYVKRTPNPDDRRHYLIAITGEGVREIDRVLSITRAANDRIREGFSETEVQAFVRMLQGILDKFK